MSTAKSLEKQDDAPINKNIIDLEKLRAEGFMIHSDSAHKNSPLPKDIEDDLNTNYSPFDLTQWNVSYASTFEQSPFLVFEPIDYNTISCGSGGCASVVFNKSGDNYINIVDETTRGVSIIADNKIRLYQHGSECELAGPEICINDYIIEGDKLIKVKSIKGN